MTAEKAKIVATKLTDVKGRPHGIVIDPLDGQHHVIELKTEGDRKAKFQHRTFDVIEVMIPDPLEAESFTGEERLTQPISQLKRVRSFLVTEGEGQRIELLLADLRQGKSKHGNSKY